MKNYKNLINIFSRKEKVYSFIVLFMVTIMSILETISVASIMPFIATIADFSIIESNKILFTIYSLFNKPEEKIFLFYLGNAIFAFFIFSLSFKALTNYMQIKFVLMLEHSIGVRLMEKYLYQPYDWFLNMHSANLGKNILSEVRNVVIQSVSPLINLIVQSIMAIMILSLLFYIDFYLTFLSILILSISYIFVFKFTTRKLVKLGRENINANKLRFTSINDAFSAIKQVKASELENIYLERFTKPSKIYISNQTKSILIGQTPRFILEGFIFGGLLFVLLYLIKNTGSLERSLPTISLFAFAGYKLAPSLQQIFAAISNLKFSTPALTNLSANLSKLKIKNNISERIEEIEFTKSITLKNVSYSFPNSTIPTINKINLSIDAKSTIGIAGITGSGKTTLVDLILCLLKPQKGTLNIDGKEINKKNIKSWKKIIGYVPQEVYLSDDSIAANIAIGVEPNKINYSRLRFAARIANLHNFITKSLQDGYSTIIGERGIRLSGGQRQRIGLARALYHKPKVLILDEATSSLDNLTESLIMNEIRKLNHKITIIIVAHRLSTIQMCDKIFLLDKGKIKLSGTYKKLRLKSKIFNKMTKITNYNKI
jgi:ABC-type bacteriocin/lantibiotic exporter with double-glycine peptidase domain